MSVEIPVLATQRPTSNQGRMVSDGNYEDGPRFQVLAAYGAIIVRLDTGQEVVFEFLELARAAGAACGVGQCPA